MKAASLANTGTINLAGGASGDVDGDVEHHRRGPSDPKRRLLQILPAMRCWSLADSGRLTAIGSSTSLTLNGSKALVALSSGLTTNSALTKLSSNAGTLLLENGTWVSPPTVALDNSLNLEIDEYGSGGSSVTIGEGSNQREDYFYVGSPNITTATTVSTGTLSNFD